MFTVVSFPTGFNSLNTGKIHPAKHSRRASCPCASAAFVFYSIAHIPMLVYILPQRRRPSLQKQPEHAKALAVAVPQADLVQKAERLRVAVQQEIPVPAGQVDALELRYPLARQPGARRSPVSL